jgi:hypothetical protein
MDFGDGKTIKVVHVPTRIAPDARLTVGLLGKSPVQSAMDTVAEIDEIIVRLQRPIMVVDND